MRLVHIARIRAPLVVAFDLARDVERWPQLLPAYRWCRILERTQNRLTFAMAGCVRGWPARWVAVQEADESARRIVFRHLHGITRGMVVEWRFESDGEDTRVVLVHDLLVPWPLVGRWITERIVVPVFLDFIARRTLEAVRARAEHLVEARE
ncbi:MAG: SRPBCC family protein [Armatimonadota bacterium]|nr:SRPBCC family protein [Armatimonadota bacterium]